MKKPAPVSAGESTGRQAKKKIALPRRQWQINPSTRVKASAKVYSRAKTKQDLRKPKNEEQT
jgi:hypothetical protein